ncbi:MAG: threonine-phosphate decarboxylase CobD [Candidatus Hydrogenedentota bacterium]
MGSFFYHGGNLREAKERFKLAEKKFIDFSANINPLGFPTKIKTIIEKNINQIACYSDPEYREFKLTLAEKINVSPHNILVGNGSMELIFLSIMCLLPQKVLIPIPTFSEYERAAKMINCDCIFLRCKQSRNFQIDINEMIKYLPRVDLIFLCNPNNPTGTLIPKAEILYLLKKCLRYNVFLIIDETFINFLTDADKVTLIKEASKNSKLLVIRSLTKIFAIPGLRLGYIVGNKRLINNISRYQPTWSVNTFAQLVGKEVLNDTRFISQTYELINKEREILFRNLKEIKGIIPFSSKTNFILAQLTNPRINSNELYNFLGKNGILIRDCSNFRGLNNRFIRICVRTRKENLKLINNIKKILR